MLKNLYVYVSSLVSILLPVCLPNLLWGSKKFLPNFSSSVLKSELKLLEFDIDVGMPNWSSNSLNF